MTTPPIDVAELTGTWRRSLLRDHCGREDRTTQVSWVQGPLAFGDLRQAPAIGRLSATCLRDLTPEQMVQLAEQEGFGGKLVRKTDHFEWARAIDYQPKAARADRGTLTWKGDVLVETGHDLPYVEHWHRDAGRATTAQALYLADSSTGRAALLVCVERGFAFVRDRAVPLAEGRPLSEIVRQAHALETMQDLLDCEISMGSVDGWVIERSTLPWRVGASLAPTRDAERFSTADLGPSGRELRRSWTIVAEEAATV